MTYNIIFFYQYPQLATFFFQSWATMDPIWVAVNPFGEASNEVLDLKLLLVHKYTNANAISQYQKVSLLKSSHIVLYLDIIKIFSIFQLFDCVALIKFGGSNLDLF